MAGAEFALMRPGYETTHATHRLGFERLMVLMGVVLSSLMSSWRRLIALRNVRPPLAWRCTSVFASC